MESKDITELNDNIAVSDDVEQTEETVAILEKEPAERLTSFLKYSGIETAVCIYNKLSGSYDVKVDSDNFEKANNLFNVFSENELETPDDEADAEEKSVNLYESSDDKYKDNLSSAITFFICGGIGIIFLLLNDFGVLHFLNSKGASFILMNVVLGLMFIIFMFIGFKSLKYAKNAKEQAAKENDAKLKIMDWLHNNVTMDLIEGSYDNSIPQEMKYFSRSSYIKDRIKDEFSELEDDIIDVLTDHYIEELFKADETSEPDDEASEADDETSEADADENEAETVDDETKNKSTDAND